MAKVKKSVGFRTKKKEEKDKSIVTKNANLNILISSIFFPTQINKKLLNKVADA